MTRNYPDRKRRPPPAVEENRREVAAAAAAGSGPKRQRSKNSVMSQPITKDADYLTYFRPNDFLIFREAYKMVMRLVHEEGPYNRKLLDLAQCSIDDAIRKKFLKDPKQFTAVDVIELALEKVMFAWADPSCKLCAEDEACAFMASSFSEDEKFLPLIAISSSFMENDYRVGEEGTPNAVTTMDDMRTKLFLFKKIKHELCHLLVRILSITEKNHFPKTATPEKYTPRKQRSRRIENPKPEVGDHDEEEDTGGPILPLYFNQKLSQDNPLCVFFEGKYFPLTDAHVTALLQIDLYKTEVKFEGRSHYGGLWSPINCRAYVNRVLDEDFFDGGIAVRRNRVAASAVSTSSSSSISSSPGRPHDSVDAFDDSISGDGTAAWRRHTIPFKIPASFFLSKSNSAEELSLTDESAG